MWRRAVTLDDLTDAEYKIVKAHAAKDLENAEAILRKKWGDQFTQRMRVVQNHV
nr:hypothetical protein [uncultured Pseudogulbenkiania sp.]